MLLPWALPLVFSGLIFRWFFEYSQGIVNDMLVALGLAATSWLTDPPLAFAAICLAIVWKTSSFVALVLLAGLQTIPRSLYEAAEIDGASAAAAVRRDHPADAAAGDRRGADLPHHHRDPDLRHSLRDDGGGPGNATETLAMYIHKTTIDFLDLGYGSALAVLMFIVSMPSRPRATCADTRRDPARRGTDMTRAA